jgi:hypothetical protein
MQRKLWEINPSSVLRTDEGWRRRRLPDVEEHFGWRREELGVILIEFECGELDDVWEFFYRGLEGEKSLEAKLPSLKGSPEMGIQIFQRFAPGFGPI